MPPPQPQSRSQPSITLHALQTANGSATYTSPSSTLHLQAGINYPLEVSRRSDEDPLSTHIEVNLRPHNGVAGVKEHHVEELVKRVLRGIVRGEDTPRCGLQCTVQVMGLEGDEGRAGGVKQWGQGDGYLGVLVGAVNAAVAACLDAGVRMRGVAGAVLLSVKRDGTVKVWPTLKEWKSSRSLHVFVYDSRGQMLLCESEGFLGMEDWEEASRAASVAVVGGKARGDGDVEMDTDEEDEGHLDYVKRPKKVAERCLLDEMRAAVEARVAKDNRCRSG